MSNCNGICELIAHVSQEPRTFNDDGLDHRIVGLGAMLLSQAMLTYRKFHHRQNNSKLCLSFRLSPFYKLNFATCTGSFGSIAFVIWILQTLVDFVVGWYDPVDFFNKYTYIVFRVTCHNQMLTFAIRDMPFKTAFTWWYCGWCTCICTFVGYFRYIY